MEEEELKKLASHLAQKHLPLKLEWLKICIKYLEKSVDANMRRSLKMFDLVMQQFLNSKISDTLNPVMKIPINASKVMIVKRMVFQVIDSKIQFQD